MSRRDWLRTFADPATLSDLRQAARACMAEVDNCDPEFCAHPDQDMSPHDFYQWLEAKVKDQEARDDGHRPVRFERGHRPRRKTTELAHVDRLNLAQAG